MSIFFFFFFATGVLVPCFLKTNTMMSGFTVIPHDAPVIGVKIKFAHLMIFNFGRDRARDYMGLEREGS